MNHSTRWSLWIGSKPSATQSLLLLPLLKKRPAPAGVEEQRQGIPRFHRNRERALPQSMVSAQQP